MKISIRGSAYVVPQDSDEPIEDVHTLAALDRWQYREDTLEYYLDQELADLGVVGGVVHTAWNDGRLELIIDFWSPRPLEHSDLEALREEAHGQMSDGMGECGFEVNVGGNELVIVPDTDEPLQIEQTDDGRPVPPAPRVAIAAREGDLDALKAALASGEPVHGTLQGYTGLHLAILYAKRDAALLLLDHGADPNRRDRFGDCPLTLCATARELSDADSAAVAAALLHCGADRTAADLDTGDTAAYYAELRGKTALLKVLREAN